MTEDRKPETDGLAEVSAKFMGEAQIASPDEALSTLWQEHERLTAQYREAIRQTDLAFVARRAITGTKTFEYHTAATALEAANARQEEVSDTVVATENRMAKMPARTIAGALLKLRVVGIEITEEFTGPDGVLDETALGSVERLSLSVLADLERLAGTATDQEPEIGALFDEWRKLQDRVSKIEVEMKAAQDANVLDTEHGEVCDKISDLEKRIIKTPVKTSGGLLTKARVAWHITALDHDLDERQPDLSALPGLDDAKVVWAVLQDVERLAEGNVVRAAFGR